MDMDVYVTQREFNNALKELKRLQTFLTDTFGSKFSDFKCNDDILEIVENPPRLGKDVSSTASSIRKCAGAPVKATIQNDGTWIEPNDEASSDGFCAGPIVTSVKSLQKMPVPSIGNTTKTKTVPILQTNKVTVCVLPSVTLSQPQNAKEPTAQYGLQKPVEVPSGDASNGLRRNAPTKRCKTVSKVTPQLRQPETSPSAKSIKSSQSSPGEFQLRGRTIFQRTTNNDSCSNDNNASSKDSVPIPIGVETMEGAPTPPKRSRPPPLPSFKKRTLGLQGNNKPSSAEPKTSSSVTTGGSENEIIQCDLCSLFVYSSQLDSHMKNHYLLDGKKSDKVNPSMSKTHKCRICSVKCTDYQMYEQHCATVHPDDGFPCPCCDRQMSTKAKLKRHMLVHRNLKFECDICGKAYNRNDNLCAHYKTHGDSKETSVYYCPECNMAFSSKPGRDKHLITHPERVVHDKDGSPNSHDDSSENETAASSTSNTASVGTVEKIKVEGTAKSQGIELEYEGDDDDL